jgi:hypothetical protein
MWIGAIRLTVQTKDVRFAGTDSLVQATVIRDGNDLRVLNLDYPAENDLEPGAIRNYDYSGPTKLPRRNDMTPPLPDGIGRTPMPYPGYGFEFSNGLPGHLRVRLHINGDDMWIMDFRGKNIRELLGSWPRPSPFKTCDCPPLKASMRTIVSLIVVLVLIFFARPARAQADRCIATDSGQQNLRINFSNVMCTVPQLYSPSGLVINEVTGPVTNNETQEGGVTAFSKQDILTSLNSSIASQIARLPFVAPASVHLENFSSQPVCN